MWLVTSSITSKTGIGPEALWTVTVSISAGMQVHMLEEVVRQLSHDLKLAEAQQKAGSSSSHAGEDVAQSPRSSPATEREMKALSARVSHTITLS